tara:strand:+ start:27 stop:395 length:369 start_codon:yes stop_codon:yes gene_type:complete
MAGRVTSKDVLAAVKEVISSVEENSPNGNLARLEDKVDAVSQAQLDHMKQQDKQFAEVNEAILKLTKRLYNPDDGIVVTVKDNTRVTKETREAVDRYSSKISSIDSEVKTINRWKSNINKTL